MSEVKSIVQIKDFTAYYEKSRNVLENIELDFFPGTFNCIIGENGSGKSTLLTSLCGIKNSLLAKKSGFVLLNDNPIEEYSAKQKAKYISYLPQSEHYTWNICVEEAVLMGRFAYSNNLLGYSANDKLCAEEALKACEIFDIKHKNIFELSGGEYQRVLLARSLAQDSKVLVLDEPFTFLDISKQSDLLKLLKNLCIDKNICVIISLHEINLSPIFADNIVLLKDGKILAKGNPKKVFTKQNLDQAYNCNFETFLHPHYNVLQVFCK